MLNDRYLTQNRKLDSLKAVAKATKKSTIYSILSEYNRDPHRVNDSHHESAQKVSLLDLFRNRILRKHLLVMTTVWFSSNVSYWGILLYLPNLGGGNFVKFLSN